MPFKRTGPGNALDGKPKFDLHQFDPDFFELLRQQVAKAQRRRVYVSVMLFEVYGFMDRQRSYPEELLGWERLARPQQHQRDRC